MNAFQAEPSDLRRDQLKALERVVNSGWYVLGKEVEAFETLWAHVCGTKYAIGVGNGMDALEIGLRSLKIGPGDEVITTPMTAFATVLAILRAGATPVLADIDAGTALLSPESVERCLSKKTKAVLLVHLYGQIRSMDRWMDLCRQAKIRLLEDCAQAHLATWAGKKAGAFGEWGAYSFYPTKNLGTLGDGGALVTNFTEVNAAARMLRNYGQSHRYHHPELGLNSRLDELHAALLQARFAWLEKFTARRRDIARMYFGSIRNSGIQLLEEPIEEENHVFHLFVLHCANRNRLLSHLQQSGIESLIHYPVPVHKQSPCLELKRDPKGLDAADFHADSCLSIPCHPQMTDEEVDMVTRTLNAF